MGRGPVSLYRKPIADEICRRLANGESLRAICRTEGMPPESTVRTWVVNDFRGFAAIYARSRDVGLDCMAEEILEVANTPEIGEEVITTNGSTTVKTGDMVAHRKLRVDTMKWYLCKLAPKKYGERLDMLHRGDPAQPIVISGTDGRL